MLHFLRLIRIPNLVIVALTQSIIYFYLILPGFKINDIRPTLPIQQFLLFILVTVLVTAGGYIINDILDYEVDLINKRDAVILHKKISLQTATWLYFSSSALGFLLAIYLAFYIHKPELVVLYPIAIGSLFMYSKLLKKMPLAGNLLIAAFAAGVAGIIGFAEFEGLQQLMEKSPETSLKIFALLGAYMLFAFYSTLFREIVKDIEDIEGDVSMNFRTLPILMGIARVKKLAMIFAVSLLLMIVAGGWLAWPAVNFIGRIVVLPVLLTTGIWSVVKLYQASNKADFHHVSQLTKLLMLTGVLLLLCIKII
ncbi:MAG: geranylgeranylglycerol-phosphate geranylgeranyltransferase [Saprospiraceae bacterium]|nr:geranylgeranylglycerol-phosphate geranylgeranyltransferase [Saprospiraceae bacterium]MCB9322197.1 geranylgeranylglycerol-phosphate geranylgeranyltransferase [Lewinellaceae bacterium]